MNLIRTFFLPSKTGPQLDTIEGKIKRFFDETVTFLCTREDRETVTPLFERHIDALLQELLSEEVNGQIYSLDYASGMEYMLEHGLFHQLIQFVRAREVSGLLLPVLSFFTTLIDCIHKQQLLEHMEFNQALLTLFLELLDLQFSDVGKDEKEAIFRLLFGTSVRIYENPGLEALFADRDESGKNRGYLVAWLLERYLLEEKVEEADLRIYRCVLMCVQLESPHVMDMVLRTTHIPKLLAARLWDILQTLLDRARKAFHTPYTERDEQLLNEYAQILDQILAQTLSLQFREVLKNELFSQVFEKVKAALHMEDRTIQSLLMFYLLQIATVVSTPQFLICFAQFLSEPYESDPSSNPNSAEIPQFSNDFFNCLTSESEILRMRSLQLLYVVVSKGNWDTIEFLFPENVHGPEAKTYLSPEDLKTMLPYAYFCNFRESEERYVPERLHAVFQVSELAKTDENLKELKTEGKRQGMLMEWLLLQTENFITNSIGENALLTGILVSLCSFPGSHSACRRLHRVLLDPNPDLHGKSLFSTLRKVWIYADQRSNRVVLHYRPGKHPSAVLLGIHI